MDHTVFTAGVNPGGLTSDYEIKVLICHILKEIAAPMTFDEINSILQSESLVNYFEFAQAISLLSASGHIAPIKNDAGSAFEITDLGTKTALTFEKDLPRAVREKALKAAQNLRLRKRLEKENEVNITKTDDGYSVELKITDIGTDLLKLAIFVPGYEQSLAVKENFLRDPAYFYRAAVALVTGDRSTVNRLLSTESPQTPN